MRGLKAKRLRKIALLLSAEKSNILSRQNNGSRIYTVQSPRRFYRHLKKTMRGKPLAALYKQVEEKE
jgi:hypothetical protein